MARTVVGIFDNESDAREAIPRLEEKGINRNNVDISTNRHWDSRSAGIAKSDMPGSRNTAETNPEYNRTGDPDFNATDATTENRDVTNQNPRIKSDKNEGFFDKVGEFFSNLFGNDEDARRYTNASLNRTIVTVHTDSQDQAKTASNILDECGAVDVNKPSDFGHTSDQDYNTFKTQVDVEKSRGGYTRSEVGRRSRIFDRPVAAEYRLNDEYYYDNTTDLDYDRNRASNLGGRGDQPNKRKL